jgi:hypothetical protein
MLGSSIFSAHSFPSFMAHLNEMLTALMPPKTVNATLNSSPSRRSGSLYCRLSYMELQP